MIKVGDIVFRKYSGGMLRNKVDHSKVGLVLELYQPPGTIAQYKGSLMRMSTSLKPAGSKDAT